MGFKGSEVQIFSPRPKIANENGVLLTQSPFCICWRYTPELASKIQFKDTRKDTFRLNFVQTLNRSNFISQNHALFLIFFNEYNRLLETSDCLWHGMFNLVKVNARASANKLASSVDGVRIFCGMHRRVHPRFKCSNMVVVSNWYYFVY